MPSEMIQVRANVARVLSPGKLRNFPRMKLWERGSPGSSDGLFPQTRRPQCQSSTSKGRESGEQSALRTCRTLLTNRWLNAKERHRENKQQDTGMNGIYFTAWHEEFKELRQFFFVSQLSRNIQALIIICLADGT